MSWFTRLLDLDAWREAALKKIDDAKEDVLKEIEGAKDIALTEICDMDSNKLSERLERVLMDSAYIIHMPERTTMAQADHLRAVVEELGAHCVVVTADTMKVLTLSNAP